VIAAGWGDGQIKSSARRAFQKASAIYFFGQSDEAESRRVNLLSKRLASARLNENLPVYTSKDLPELITRIRHIHSARDLAEEATVKQSIPGGWYV
jgi:hypothetical protein